MVIWTNRHQYTQLFEDEPPRIWPKLTISGAKAAVVASVWSIYTNIWPTQILWASVGIFLIFNNAFLCVIRTDAWVNFKSFILFIAFIIKSKSSSFITAEFIYLPTKDCIYLPTKDCMYDHWYLPTYLLELWASQKMFLHSAITLVTDRRTDSIV